VFGPAQFVALLLKKGGKLPNAFNPDHFRSLDLRRYGLPPRANGTLTWPGYRLPVETTPESASSCQTVLNNGSAANSYTNNLLTICYVDSVLRRKLDISESQSMKLPCSILSRFRPRNRSSCHPVEQTDDYRRNDFPPKKSLFVMMLRSPGDQLHVVIINPWHIIRSLNANSS
jgi:hypothetical protein